uniref:Uncharacterized protein n=1 Tax=Tanacetum cinerariifolium TaxID=118510 RepID=A0A6L2JMG3_TANCI|nr:hypothetical protein [Tanacetum cinerariifolium]
MREALNSLIKFDIYIESCILDSLVHLNEINVDGLIRRVLFPVRNVKLELETRLDEYAWEKSRVVARGWMYPCRWSPLSTLSYVFVVEVIEFGDSYKAPQEETGKGPASESSAKKKGRTVVITTEDMQKRRNDVKARTTLLLALPDEHQLRFCKYETTKELWEAILKTFGGNEATKKTKKNQLKQQYGNFKAEGSETFEQTFNRLRAIVSHLEFMDVEIEQDDLNHKFLTSLALEWLMYTIVWRNTYDLNTMSLDDVYNHLKVYELEVQKKSEKNSQNMAFISSSNTSSGKEHGSIEYEGMQVLEEDWECRAPRSQDRGKRESYKQENHALVADDEAPTEYALMAKSSLSSKNEFPPPAQVYSPPKKDLSWTGLPEFVDDTVTDYSRPTPSIDSVSLEKSNENVIGLRILSSN